MAVVVIIITKIIIIAAVVLIRVFRAAIAICPLAIILIGVVGCIIYYNFDQRVVSHMSIFIRYLKNDSKHAQNCSS